jgi:Biotin-lipoyl like
MQHIRKRPRLDKLINQQRSSKAAWGRRVYLALVCALALALVNYFLGDAMILRADGILLTDRQIIAATYPAKVAAVRVKEGESVAKGAVLVELESADMLRDIADLSVRNADLSAREAQLRVSAANVRTLLPLAERNARQGAGAVARIDSLADRGLISTQSMTQALASGYDTAAKLAELRGQSEVLADEYRMSNNRTVAPARRWRNSKAFMIAAPCAPSRPAQSAPACPRSDRSPNSAMSFCKSTAKKLISWPTYRICISSRSRRATRSKSAREPALGRASARSKRS